MPFQLQQFLKTKRRRLVLYPKGSIQNATKRHVDFKALKASLKYHTSKPTLISTDTPSSLSAKSTHTRHEPCALLSQNPLISNTNSRSDQPQSIMNNKNDNKSNSNTEHLSTFSNIYSSDEDDPVYFPTTEELEEAEKENADLIERKVETAALIERDEIESGDLNTVSTNV